MIALSESAGLVFSPTNAVVAKMRDALVWAMGLIPSVRRYFLEMRFKPMPRYKEGALVYTKNADKNPIVGRMFIQPMVETSAGICRIDDVLGNGFVLLAWGTDPRRWMDDAARALVAKLGIRCVLAVPSTQAENERERTDLLVLGDVSGRLKTWFGEQDTAFALLRPDRFVAATCLPQQLSSTLAAFGAVAHINNCDA